MTWRERCRGIIRQVLRETKGQDEKAIRRALRDAYPFGERAMFPYKAWLSEVREQRGKGRARGRQAAPAGQGDLFSDGSNGSAPLS